TAELGLALRKHFGFASFRPNQERIITAILDGRDVFAALPTGGGKSLCYQLPALMKDGLTVVVSPLIALMKDQVDAARENGIPAAFLNSTLSAEDARETWRSLAGGRTRLLYVSPERLAFADFRAALQGFGLARVAVDEAHCISEWGHEFRPDYRALGLLRSEFPGVPLAAFTATATQQVQQDVVRLLGLRTPLLVRASFDRPEIFYRVALKEGNGDAQVLSFIKAHDGQPGIVYRGTRKAVETTAAYLVAHGVSAAAYHAGIDDENRRRRQEAFVRDEVTVVVATIAFGMGIDKSNVRWVVHGDLPRSVEGYYQETGRAARDGEPADTVLFYGPADIASLRWHIGNTEVEAERARAEARLREILAYVESSVCRRTLLLAHFDEQHPGNCGRCDVCTGELVRSDTTEEALKVFSAVARTGERFGGHHLADILVGNPTDKVLERGHQNLPTFGIGRDHEKTWWLSLIQELAAAQHLLRGEGRLAGYRLSDTGRLMLRGKGSFFSAQAARPASAAEAQAAELPEGGIADQEELLLSLKRLRKKIAQARSLPPYVIFSDKTLRAMAKSRPIEPAAFLRCPGVGDHKLAAYGSAFMNAIRDFASGAEPEE
ncbi:MAG: DNA helicase RecQ, partial [Spirochaetia bacterium]